MYVYIFQWANVTTAGMIALLLFSVIRFGRKWPYINNKLIGQEKESQVFPRSEKKHKHKTDKRKGLQGETVKKIVHVRKL